MWKFTTILDDHRLVDQGIEQVYQSCDDIDQRSCQSNRTLSGERKENEVRFGKERRKGDTLDQIDAKYRNHEGQNMSKTVESNQNIRKKYFSDLIDSLQGCKSFEELRTISKADVTVIDEKFPLCIQLEKCTILAIKKGSRPDGFGPNACRYRL